MLLIETLMDGLQPVFAKWEEFETGNKSKLIPPFGQFSITTFCLKIRKDEKIQMTPTEKM